MPLVVQCACCRRMLQVRDADVGKMVRCPSCGQVFAARAGSEVPPPPPRAVPDFEMANDAPPDPAPIYPVSSPSGNTNRAVVPRSLNPAGETYAVKLEGDALAGRRRRRRRRPSDPDDRFDVIRPHRGTLVLVLGALSIVFACIPPAGWALGGVAMSMAAADDRLMEQHVMDRSGRGMTKAGQVCGIVGVFLSTVAFIMHLFVTLSSLRR